MPKLVSIILPAFLLLVSAGGHKLSPAATASAAQRVVYKTYANARYGYSIAYPSSLLVPQGEADNGDGQAFRSRDGRAEMRAYGSQDMGGGLAAAYREAQDGKTITYKTMKRNWFVVSGHSGAKVFYQKTILRGGALLTFTIEYDESEKGTYDAVTARVARSFNG